MKIDVTKIAGYAEMSAEAKLAALEAFDYDDGAGEIEKLKQNVIKANGDAADWKKKHNALLAEKGNVETESNERVKTLEAQVAEMLKTTRIAETKAKFTALGYSEELADETAKAFVDGDTDTFFANQKKFNDERTRILNNEKIQKTPAPPAGQGKTSMTKDEYGKLSLFEKQQLHDNNKELYKKLNSEE
jgi:hypothetical protein